MKKEVVITARVDAEIHEMIRQIAKEEDRTIAWVVRRLIVEGLENKK